MVDHPEFPVQTSRNDGRAQAASHAGSAGLSPPKKHPQSQPQIPLHLRHHSGKRARYCCQLAPSGQLSLQLLSVRSYGVVWIPSATWTSRILAEDLFTSLTGPFSGRSFQNLAIYGNPIMGHSQSL